MSESGERKKDAMLAEWIVRIVALERTLIKKNLVTQDELNDSFVECLTEYGKVMASQRGLDKKE